MKILVACEFSGIVRDAFRKHGHDAWSCDILPTEADPTYHIQGDVLEILDDGWDMMIAHPPCTDLCISGARWFSEKIADGRQQAAINFFKMFTALNCPRIVIENPVGIMSTHYRKPDQIIQPWQFGHPETKKTCLWLKNLPKLVPTNIIEPQYIIGKDGKKYSPVHYCSQWKDNEIRWKIRSRTYTGMADAMAEQWGGPS
jgi:site-specific DNA-cytosine methylase